MACDFDITKENIYDYIIEDTPGADEAIKALSGICSQRADSQWIIAHGELPDNRQLNISALWGILLFQSYMDSWKAMRI